MLAAQPFPAAVCAEGQMKRGSFPGSIRIGNLKVSVSLGLYKSETVSHSLLLMLLGNTPLPLQRAHGMARLVGGAQLTLPDAHPSSFLPVGVHGMLRGRHRHGMLRGRRSRHSRGMRTRSCRRVTKARSGFPVSTRQQQFCYCQRGDSGVFMQIRKKLMVLLLGFFSTENSCEEAQVALTRGRCLGEDVLLEVGFAGRGGTTGPTASRCHCPGPATFWLGSGSGVLPRLGQGQSKPHDRAGAAGTRDATALSPPEVHL